MIEFKQEIAKPEWLEDSLLGAERTFRLARDGKIPDSIKGWMIKNRLPASASFDLRKRP